MVCCSQWQYEMSHAPVVPPQIDAWLRMRCGDGVNIAVLLCQRLVILLRRCALSGVPFRRHELLMPDN